MIDLFTIVTAVLWGLSAAALGCAVFSLRWIIFPAPTEKSSVELAMHVSRGIAVLHALMIALVLAEAQIDYTRAREELWRETDLLHRVFYNLTFYETEAAREMRSLLVDYTRTLIDAEWELLAQDRLSPRASELFQEIFAQVLQLQASGSGQSWLRDDIRAGLTELAQLRHNRFFEANDRLPGVFWLSVFLGFLLLCALFSVYERSRLNVILIAAFSTFFGTVAYLIFAFHDPFDGHLRVAPQPILMLHQEVMLPTLLADEDDPS